MNESGALFGYLRYAASMASPSPTPTPTPSYTLSAPATGTAGVAVSVVVTPSMTVASDTLTPSDDGGAAFTPASATLTNSAAPATFSCTFSSAGTYHVSATSGHGYAVTPTTATIAISAPSPTPSPTPTYALAGPTTGSAGVAASYTLTPGTTVPSDSVSLSDGGHGGVFAPTSLAFTNTAQAAGFTYTNGTAGSYTLTPASGHGYAITPPSIALVLSSPTPTPTPSPTPAESCDTDPDAVTVATLSAPDPTVAATDPDALSLAGAAMPAAVKLTIGYAHAEPLQCWADDGSKAAFAAGDTLAAELWPSNRPGPVASVPVAWYTARGAQTGYDQGQVLATFSAALVGTLQPSLGYQLRVKRTLAADGSTELIGRCPVAVSV